MPDYFNRYLTLKVWPSGAKDPITLTQDWKITYKVKKCSSAVTMSYNTAEISIYNATSEIRELIAQKYNVVELDAGYVSNHGVIFSGYLYNLVTVKNNTDIVTTLYCATNTQIYGETVNKCVQNVLVTDLIAQICEEHGVSYRLPFKRNDVVQKSYTGSFGKVIAQICREYDISCGLDNGELLFRDRKTTEGDISKSEIKVLTPSSGLLGNPTVTERGVKVKSLLQPFIQVNDYFRLEAPYANYAINNISNTPGLILGNELNVFAHIDTHNYNGVYMALSLTESGDTRGNSWYTEIEGSKVWPEQPNAR